MLYQRDVQGEGGAVLSNGASISGDSDAPMVPDHQPTIRQVSGCARPHAPGGHHDPGVGGTRHGVQRERHRGGQPVSGSWVLSEATDRLARVRFSIDASHLTYRLHALEEALHSDVGLHVAAACHGPGAIARCGGQGCAAMVAVGAHLGSAGGNGQARGSHLYGLLPALIVIGLLSGLVLLEPDLGTVVVLGLVTVAMCFLAGARISHLLALGLCAIPVVLVLVLGFSYRRQRLMSFLAPWKDASDTGFQITQSFLAFGSGGPLGVGLGEGKQKLYFLPEAHTDFVLALVGEELGLIGTATVTLLFAFFVWRGVQIAARARVPFGRYLGMGITLLIGGQALVNAAVVTGLLPTKGLTLPFVSYGGSSLVVSLIGVGILLSISRDRHAGGSRGGRGGLDHG